MDNIVILYLKTTVKSFSNSLFLILVLGLGNLWATDTSFTNQFSMDESNHYVLKRGDDNTLFSFSIKKNIREPLIARAHSNCTPEIGEVIFKRSRFSLNGKPNNCIEINLFIPPEYLPASYRNILETLTLKYNDMYEASDIIALLKNLSTPPPSNPLYLLDGAFGKATF